MILTTTLLRCFLKVLQTALLQAPALSLPTVSELNLFVSERKSMALGVMTQPQGSHRQPVVSIAMLVPEALKFTSGRNLTVLISHDVSRILNSKVQSDNGSTFKAAVTQGVSKL